MNKAIVQIQIRAVYGRDLIYPMCKTAQLLCKLTGRSTFSNEHLLIIQELGYSIEYVPYKGEK